jgi:hypothetical protein
MIRHLVATSVLAVGLQAGIPATLDFSSNSGTSVGFVGAGSTSTMTITGGSTLTGANGPYASLLGSTATITGVSTLSNLITLGLSQTADASGPQLFTLTTPSGSFLTANLLWPMIQSTTLPLQGGFNVFNPNGVFNLTGLATNLNGNNAAQDAALAMLASTGLGQLTLNPSDFRLLSDLFAVGPPQSFASFSMELIATPEPQFVLVVALLGGGLFWARRRWAPVSSPE